MSSTTEAPVTGTALAEILKTEGRTQRWLARAVGISPPMMGRIVHGRRVPDVKQAHDIARALGRDVADLGWLKA